VEKVKEQKVQEDEDDEGLLNLLAKRRRVD